MPAGPSSRSILAADAAQLACTHSSYTTSEDPPTSALQRLDMVVGLASCHMAHMLKQDKGVHTESESGKYIPIQGDKPSTGCKALYLLVKTCSRPKAHSYGTNGC